MKTKFATYQDWSQAFTDARAAVGDCDGILKLWAANVPPGWADRPWKGDWGYRKKSKAGAELAGEKGIERRLLGDPGTLKLLRLRRLEDSYPLAMTYHNFPLTNQRKGQVLADVLAIVRAGRRQRPLLVEVKKTDETPWYALVECLKQVRLARSSGQRICDLLKKIVSPLDAGAWGLVVAPSNYFRKEIKECEKLLTVLKEKTKARIAFATISIKEPELQWKIGNWE